jgi:anaerobic selenocysteine-containing dehydrogenase
MKHYDYDWDLSPEGIIFDKELDIDKLGWKHGDYFKITNVNGQAKLVKVDPLIKFLKDGAKKNEQMESVVRESTGTY